MFASAQLKDDVKPCKILKKVSPHHVFLEVAVVGFHLQCPVLGFLRSFGENPKNDNMTFTMQAMVRGHAKQQAQEKNAAKQVAERPSPFHGPSMVAS